MPRPVQNVLKVLLAGFGGRWGASFPDTQGVRIGLAFPPTPSQADSEPSSPGGLDLSGDGDRDRELRRPDGAFPAVEGSEAGGVVEGAPLL